MKKNINLSFIFIIIAAFMWGVDGVFFTPRYFTYNLNNTKIIVFLAHLFPTILLFFYSPKKIMNCFKKFKIKDYANLLSVSVIGGVIGTLSIVKALQLVEFNQFSIVALIQQLQPIFATILAIVLLKEKPKKSFKYILIISIISIYILKFGLKNPLEINKIELAPVFFSVVAAISFGFSTVLGRKVTNNYDYYTISFFRFFLTTVITLILIIHAKGEILILKNTFYDMNILLNAIIIMFWGIISTIFYYRGISKVSAISATLSELAYPFTSVLLNIVVYNVKFNFIQILAAIILIFSILYYNLERINK